MKAADVANTVSACLVTKQHRVQCKMNAINIALWVSFVCVCVCWVGIGFVTIRVHSLLWTAGDTK